MNKSIKRFLSFIIAFTMFFSTITFSFAEELVAEESTAEIDKTEVLPGEKLTLKVHLAGFKPGGGSACTVRMTKDGSMVKHDDRPWGVALWDKDIDSNGDGELEIKIPEDLEAGKYEFEAMLFGAKGSPTIKLPFEIKSKEGGAVPQEPITINSVEKFEKIKVEYGTKKEDIKLPQEIILNLSDGSSREIDVTWTNEDYDRNKTGEYTFIGNYDLPEGVKGIKSEVKLIVEVRERKEAKIINIEIMNFRGDKLSDYKFVDNNIELLLKDSNMNPFDMIRKNENIMGFYLRFKIETENVEKIVLKNKNDRYDIDKDYEGTAEEWNNGIQFNEFGEENGEIDLNNPPKLIIYPIDGEPIEYKLQFKDERDYQQPGEEKPSRLLYEFDRDTGTIEKYKGNGGSVTIPRRIDGVEVKHIENEAFYNKNITSIEIPDTVVSIGSNYPANSFGAFQGNRLTSIVIPSSVESIGLRAFSDNELKEVTITEGVKQIEARAFENNQIESINLPDSIMDLGMYAFNNNKLTSIKIPNKLEIIKDAVFANNKLTSLDIPKSIEIIGKSAFKNNQLKTIVIPNNVGAIYSEAFVDNKLTSIMLNDNLKVIDNSSFRNNSLKTIRIPDSVEEIGEMAFAKNRIEEVKIPEGINTIQPYTFWGNRLKKLEIPEGIKRIGSGAFSENRLISVFIPENVEIIEEYAFKDNKISQGKAKIDNYRDKIEIGDRAFEYNGIDNAVEITPVFLKGEISDTDAPTIEVKGFKNGQELEDEKISFKVIVRDNIDKSIKPKVMLNNEVIIATNGTYSASLIDGENIIIIEAIDLSGNRTEMKYKVICNPVINPGEKLEVVSIDPVKKVVVGKGTEKGKIGLPEKITLKLSNGRKIRTDVNWINEEYNLSKEGEYIFTGKYELPPGLIGEKPETKVEVIVTETADFEFDEETGSIIDYHGDSKALVIPSKINGVRVNKIEKEAFNDKSLTSVEIPEGVIDIEQDAFNNNKLTKVNIPDTVKTIGDRAFMDNELTEVLIPKDIVVIRDGVFQNNKIKSIVFPKNLKRIESDSFKSNDLTKIEIPEGVINVGGSAFSRNKLIEINIPESVKEVGSFAFSNNKLIKVEIPEGVIEIGSRAFANNELTEINIPKSITKIEMAAFIDNELDKVNIPGNIVNIGEYAFRGNKITEVNISEGVQSIEKGAFSNNELTEVVIPESVFKIDNNAFEGNKIVQGKAKINNYKEKVEIGEGAFNNNGADGKTEIMPVFLKDNSKDIEAPVINVIGIKDGQVITEEQISFKVSVTDNVDKNIEPKVMLNNKVITGTDGNYTAKLNIGENVIIIEATDVAGNKADIKYNLIYKTIDKNIIEEQLDKNFTYILKNTPNPMYGTIRGEWSVLSLARGGYDVSENYYDIYYNNVVDEVKKLMVKNDGKLEINKSTEHSRVILGLTSIGKDISDVGGYDLKEALADFDFVIRQGINGPTFVLIALDSHNYEIPVADKVRNQTTRQKMVEYLLKQEIKRGTSKAGGWALEGAYAYEPDPDMTAMVVQALTPYYETNTAVKAAVDRAITWLSNVQRDDGGYLSWGSVNSESVAQVIVALTGLGIDPHTDPRFVKNGNSAIDALMSFAVPEGGFMHVKAGAPTGGGGTGGVANPMATDQGTYALVAYNRFIEGKNSLYDMTDVKIEGVEDDLTIVSVDSIEDIIVEYGTEKESLELPEKIRLNLSNGDKKDVEVKWTSEDYNGNKSGEYTFVGRYDLPEGVTGEKLEVNVNVKVRVKEEPKLEVNKDKLKEIINKTEKLDLENKTEESIKALNEAISKGKEILNKEEVAQEEINGAVKAIETAIENLKDEEKPEPKPEVDKTRLEEIINKAENIELGGKTEDSIKVLNEAIAKGKEILNKEEVTQEELDNAVKNIELAIKNLEDKKDPESEPEVDKIKLEEIINKAKNINTKCKTENSIKVLNEAIAKGKEILNKKEMTQEDIDNAVKSIEDAINSLKDEEKPTKPQTPSDSEKPQKPSKPETINKPNNEIAEPNMQNKSAKTSLPKTGQSSMMRISILGTTLLAIGIWINKRRHKEI